MSDARRELFNACDPLAPATAEYYVDCTAVRGSDAFVNDVLGKLALADRPLRFLFSGHVGSGKSSELEHLSDYLERPKAKGSRFLPILLDAGEYLNDYDVTPTDILLSIVAEVAATLKEKAGIELKDSYFARKFDDVLKLLNSEVELSEGEISLWAVKAKLKLLKEVPSAREKVREMLIPQMPTILMEIKTVFEQARLRLKQRKLGAGESPFADIVLILDNLEKIVRIGNRKEGEESQRHLFIECAPQLTGLDAHVIYTVPLRLVRSCGPELMAAYGVTPFVLPMIKVEERETHKPYKEGKARLRELLQKRAGSTPLDDVFTHEALDWLLTYCGGHVRELMGFVQQACSEVAGLPIDIKAARRSLNRTISLFDTSIPATYWPKLARLERSSDQKIDNNDPEFRRMLEMLIVMEYINGGIESDPFSRTLVRGQPNRAPALPVQGRTRIQGRREEAVSESSIVDDDPFAPAPPDEVAERDALSRAIELSQGFSLLIACCNRADHRDRLIANLLAQLPGLRVQSVPLREPVRNLLIELRTRLESPPPDAVFVYGVEGWLPSGVEAEDNPFIRNLNAARNHFPREVPCPLVFWLPQHILTTLARAAPDFCSVRSGLYSFCAAPEIRERAVRSLTSAGMAGIAGLSYVDKFERALALAAMLSEYKSLPHELRDPLAELRLINSSATLQQVLGNFKAAEPLFQMALEIAESSLGSDHLNTATVLNNLANLYDSQGRYAEAEPLYRRALEIDESSLGPDHPGTATGLNNLANLYNLQGRSVEAEPLYRRSLEIRESSLGPDHPDTATSLNNLAYLYQGQGRHAEAEPLYRRALEIIESSLGSDHPYTAGSLNNLAYLYQDQGRHAEAEPLYRRSLEIRESSLGPDHPDTATGLNNLANLYSLQGRHVEAEPLYRRALEITESSLGPDHPNMANFFGNYADLLHQIGKEGEATSLTARAQLARDAHARLNAKASDVAASE